MLLDMRDKQTNELISRDILDIDMILSIENFNGKYGVSLSDKYRADELFDTKEEAENYLKTISSMRNEFEGKLLEYE